MKTFISVLIIGLLLTNLSFAQSTFQKIYDYSESNQPYNIVALSDGSYAYLSIVDEPNGTRQVLLTKLDCTANVEWAKKYGLSSSLNNVFAGIIEADNGDIVFAYNIGEFQNYNIIVGRIQKDGTPIWKKIYGGNRDDQGLDLIQTNDGSFVIVGKTNSWGTDVSGLLSRTDIYIFKIDGNGEVLWTQTYGTQGATDDAYAVVEDTDGSLVITGRVFYEGYFRCLLMKTDAVGNIIFNHGFGKFDHTARGFDVKVTSDDKYVITGSTTIAKDNFSSLPDPFLIKTNKDGFPEFQNVYEISVGSDNSESVSSIVELPDGSFAIGVPTQSFSSHTMGFVPNKNAVYFIDVNGNLTGAKIYNQGGSHYTRLLPARDGGFVLSNYTNFYNSTAGEFRALIIKTDENFESGCNEIDVSNEVVLANRTWETIVLTLTNSNGGQDVTTNTESDFQYDDITTLCETLPPPPIADFSFDNACLNDVILFTDQSEGNVLSWEWDFDSNGSSMLQDPEFTFIGAGSFPVQLIVDDGCLRDTVTKSVELDDIIIGSLLETICIGEDYFFNGVNNSYPNAGDVGTYAMTDTLVSYQGCDSIVFLTLNVVPCSCELTFPNVFSPDNDGFNDTFGPVIACDQTIKNYHLLIYDRWGENVFDTYDYDKRWDGTLNGLPLPRDVFMYMVQYEIEGGGETTFTSEVKDFTLVR